MPKFPSNLLVHDESLKVVVIDVWNKAEQILSNSLFPHFTDHSIAHSERVAMMASSLIGTKIKLSDTEKFILLCAIALHDIGMQTNEYIENSCFPLTNIDLDTIREKHHIFSYKYITDNFNRLGLSGASGLVDYIAMVAMNHRRTNINLIKDEYISGVRIRIKLLSALIRLADCLDCDFNRVNIGKLVGFNIENKSKAFWFCHYYVQSVRVEKERIILDFRFPKEYENSDEIYQIHQIIEFIKSEITKQINELYDVFYSYHVVFHKDPVNSNVNYLVTLEPMPKEALKFVASELTKHVTEDQSFVAYQKRSEAISGILSLLEKENHNNLCFFGGISSTVLCSENTIGRITNWLKHSDKTNVFMCYEVGEAAHSRANALNLPDAISHMERKVNDIEASRALYPQKVSGRVHYIPISVPLNHYIIILDNEIYWNPLTEQRSTETVTLKAKNSLAGNKAKSEHIHYMLSVLDRNKNANAGYDEVLKLVNYIKHIL